MPPEHTVEAPTTGITRLFQPKRRLQNRYLLLADYRQLDLVKTIDEGDLAAIAFHFEPLGPICAAMEAAGLPQAFGRETATVAIEAETS